VVVLNFTPVPRHGYRIGVPKSGVYHEVFNSDSGYYGGGNVGNYEVQTEAVSWMNQPHSTVLTLPPLAGIILQHLPDKRLVQPIEIAEVPPSEDTTE
jgi:1,4-alpha-glucan branching enzyme